jgi:hypothetical protein
MPTDSMHPETLVLHSGHRSDAATMGRVDTHLSRGFGGPCRPPNHAQYLGPGFDTGPEPQNRAISASQRIRNA